MANILIIGGGFGGLITAERLAKKIDVSQHQITLVAPNNSFTFYPALVHLAFGECDEADITFDMRTKLEDLGVRFVRGQFIHLDPGKKTARIAGDDLNGEIAYDYVVLAMGRRLATEHTPGFFENASHLLGIRAAKDFGKKIADFTDGTIVLGSCPDGRLPVPVCETAFALARRFEMEMGDGSVRIKVIFPQSLQDAFGGAQLHKELESAFQRHGINVLYDIPISKITADKVHSSEGHEIDYDLLMLIPPFRGQAILGNLGITDEHDFVKVDDHMKIHDLENGYAVGDIVAFSGPKFAHMAVRQADVAATNLAAELEGRTPTAEYYHQIATVIDAGGPDSIFLHYGIWDNETYSLRKGHVWGWAKDLHDKVWRARHN
jgi:sulfide:quinone oxidoreductase